MKFNVILCNVNTRKITEYDIIPYLKGIFRDSKEKPKTFEEFKEFIIKESRYQWWARCQYEVIISSWPPGFCEDKWDVHRQVMMNIDTITNILMEEVK